MWRRGATVAVGIAALILLGTIPGASAHSLPDPTGYVGEWTPDNASPGLVAGEHFTVAASDEATARAATANYASYFDSFCKSTEPGVPPVSYFTVSEPWSPAVTLGGCESTKTGGHLYSFYMGPGPQYDAYILYAHTATSNGVTNLNGGWEFGSPSVTDKFTAHHPVAQFLVHAKIKTVTKSKKKGYVGLLATFAAAGEIPVVDTPNSNCASVGLAGGYGSATLRLVKIGGPNLVELDDVTVSLTGTFGTGDDYQSCASEGDIIRGIDFKVTKSDPHEVDSCPVGSEGDMNLVDHSGQDEVVFHLPKCKLSFVLRQKQTQKGSHLAVAINLNENGY